MELKRLVPNHLLQHVLGRFKVVPGPVEWLLAFGLNFFVVEAFEVWVLKALLHSVSLLGVEYQHLS